MKKLPAQGDIGFFDGQDLEPGEEWPTKLAEGLRMSQVMVSLYSPAYFTREYCGKEYHVFRSRVDEYAKQLSPGSQRPPLILPVLLQPRGELPMLPVVVADIQYEHDDYPQIYKNEGLRYMMKLSRYKDDYEHFVTRMAERIVGTAKAHPLPPLPNLQPIKTIESAFHEPSPPILARANDAENRGPRFAQFIFVAGRKDELRPVR